jgi:hypothetical protein
MIELWMTQAVSMPSEFVAQLRQASFWPAQEAFAHTLVYDTILIGDVSLPTGRLARITVETLAPASLWKHSRVVLYQRAEWPPPGT